MRTRLLLACLAALAALAGVSAEQIPIGQPATSTTVQSCGIDTDLFQLDSITLQPDPPAKGQPLRVVVKGRVLEPVGQGATVDVNVKLGRYITILKKQFQLCDLAGEFSETCPIGAGDKEWVKEIDLPAVIPPGRFVADVRMEAAGKRVACFSADFAF
ncbi:ML domain-containing protein [Hyaloraphidium curvatum]|nr:ML domain-containing protein [Hyaloraphidium curvatum]